MAQKMRLAEDYSHVIKYVLNMVKRLYIINFLLICSFFIASCHNHMDDREKIIKLYASKQMQKNEYIFNKSFKNIQAFKEILEPPIKLEKLKRITKTKGKIDLYSVVKPNIIQYWNNKFKNYKQVTWDKKKLKNLPLITQNQIPKYISEGDIPKPREKDITIHYLSTPFIHNNVALLFFTQKSSQLNGSSGFNIYAKQNGQWKLIAVSIIMIVH